MCSPLGRRLIRQEKAWFAEALSNTPIACSGGTKLGSISDKAITRL